MKNPTSYTLNRFRSYDSIIMSLLVSEYRKLVAAHATIAKRQEALREARDWYLAHKEMRENAAKPVEDLDPWWI